MKRVLAIRLVWAAALLALLLFCNTTPAQSLAEKLAAEIVRGRAALDAMPASDVMNDSIPALKGQLTDAELLLNSKQAGLALETLASAMAQIRAVAVAREGWGKGKGIEELQKEWEKAGASLQAARGKFPARMPPGQPLLYRAIAEQSLGQVQENYAASLDYGRFSGLEFGAFYIGYARGSMDFALFGSALTASPAKLPLALPSMTGHVAEVEKEIVTAYAKPGSTAQHAMFIIANSSLKMAREMDNGGYEAGALFVLLRSLLALGQATTPPAGREQTASLQATADQFANRFATDRRDHSIGEAYLEKARASLEKSTAEGEAGDRQRLRAAVLLNFVLPRYFAFVEGKK